MNTTPEQRQIKADRNTYIFHLARAGHTSKQIAEKVDLSASAVRGIVFKMRKEVEKEQEER